VRGDPLDFSKPLAHRQKQEAVGHTPSFLGKDETSAWGEGEGEGLRLEIAVSPSPVALRAPASPRRGEARISGMHAQVDGFARHSNRSVL